MRDRRSTLALVAVLTAVMVPLHPNAAAAALGARASVTPRSFQAGSSSVEFSFRIANASSSNGERIGSVDIATPGSEWQVISCPDAPSGWSARVDSGSRCLFESAHGSSDDIGPGGSSTDFAVRVNTRSIDAGDAGTWEIHVQHTDSFNPGDEHSSNRADGADASPDGAGALTVTARAAPSPTASPSPTKSPSPTPSKTPTPTSTPATTPTPTATRTQSTSPTPTPTRTNDPDPDPTPSASPTPSPTPAPSPTPPPPDPPAAPNLVPASDTGVSDRDELTKAETIVISGTAPGADTVEVLVDGTLAVTAPVANDGSYRIELPPLPDGTHEIVVVVVESGAPESPPSEPLVVTIDRTAPHVSITQPVSGSTITDATPTFAGEAGRVTGDLVPVTIDLYRVNGDDLIRRGEYVVFRTGGTWDLELPAGDALNPGTYTVLARQADAAGNVGASSPVTFTVASPPQPTPTASTTPTPTPTTSASPTPVSPANTSPTPTPSPTPAPPTAGGGGGGGGGAPAPGPSNRPPPPSEPRSPGECTTCGTPRDDSVTIGDGDLRDSVQRIETGDGADEITIDFTDPGKAWNMTIEAGEGNDTIVVNIAGSALSQGEMTIVGGGGDDMIMVNAQVGVKIVAGAGNDIIGGGSGSDVVSAGSGNDTIDAGDGNDGVTGGIGNDVVIGQGGNDTLSGGDGDDVLEGDAPADPSMSPVTFMMRSGSVDPVAPGSDTLLGGTGNDIARAGGGKDTVQGGAGDDILRGLAGADVMFGNDDDDVVSGGSGNDSVRGNGGADALSGNRGADRMNGGLGNDTISGGAGHDVLHSGGGEDALNGGTGSDRCVADRNDSRRTCEKR